MVDVRTYRSEEELKDGTQVTVRAIRADDRWAVLAAFSALDPESIFTRFFTYKKALSDAELRQATDVDFDRVVALIVTTGVGGEERLIGGGRYALSEEPGPLRRAELAFLTGNDYRGRGVASLILRHLVEIARETGVSRFDAFVRIENHAMLSVFRRSGLPMSVAFDGSIVRVTLSLDENGADEKGPARLNEEPR